MAREMGEVEGMGLLFHPLAKQADEAHLSMLWH